MINKMDADKWLTTFLAVCYIRGRELADKSPKFRNDGFRQFWHRLEKIDISANLNQKLQDIAQQVFECGMNRDQRGFGAILDSTAPKGEEILEWDGDTHVWDERLYPLNDKGGVQK